MNASCVQMLLYAGVVKFKTPGNVVTVREPVCCSAHVIWYKVEVKCL